MPPVPDPVVLPKSYNDYPFREIKLSHHPASSATVTPIIILTLYRPKNHNAFTSAMCSELELAYAMLSLDERVKAIVTTGHGRMFCAGADLEQGFAIEESETEHRDGGGRAALAVHHCQKPVIGAIQGAAVGVGMTMTLPMTIRVALRTAKIGFVFARRGLVSEGASSFFLPKLIGMSRALHIVSTGAIYQAQDRLLDGLFTEFGDTPEQVLEKAIAIAQDIADNCSTVSSYLIRELMYRGPPSAEETHLLDSRILFTLRSSRDNKEGVQSFLEKRPAKFEGSLAKDAPPVYPWWAPVDIRQRVKAKGMGPAKL